MSDHYFTFPLAVLHGQPKSGNVTPLSCVELALSCGILNAGIGFRHLHGDELFEEKFHDRCDDLEMGELSRPDPGSDHAEVIVGSSICGVKLGSTNFNDLQRTVLAAQSIPKGGPLVKMKGQYFWAALSQLRAENDHAHKFPDHGISWREFRILCAILSSKTNRKNFAFIGWESIQARSCGFTTKAAMKQATKIPYHLAPKLTHKQIRATCDTLEALGFYARFRFSRGSRGGQMAYSFRHSREELAVAVCDFKNFQDRAGIKENRASDAEKCLELLERAKVGQSQGNGGAKPGQT